MYTPSRVYMRRSDGRKDLEVAYAGDRFRQHGGTRAEIGMSWAGWRSNMAAWKKPRLHTAGLTLPKAHPIVRIPPINLRKSVLAGLQLGQSMTGKK